MKTKINPDALYWASFNSFEMRLPGQCVIECYHAGRCDADVTAWADRVRAQIQADKFPNSPSKESIRAELQEYGAWDDEELSDDEQNFHRLVWIAAGNIADEAEPDCSEPVKGGDCLKFTFDTTNKKENK